MFSKPWRSFRLEVVKVGVLDRGGSVGFQIVAAPLRSWLRLQCPVARQPVFVSPVCRERWGCTDGSPRPAVVSVMGWWLGRDSRPRLDGPSRLPSKPQYGALSQHLSNWTHARLSAGPQGRARARDCPAREPELTVLGRRWRACPPLAASKRHGARRTTHQEAIPNTWPPVTHLALRAAR